jgi:hypothetical protein
MKIIIRVLLLLASVVNLTHAVGLRGQGAAEQTRSGFGFYGNTALEGSRKLSMIALGIVSSENVSDTPYYNADGSVCFDKEANWRDVAGHTCLDYQTKEYCDPEKGTVSGMKKVYQTIATVTGNSNIAQKICCTCGGGETVVLPNLPNVSLDTFMQGKPRLDVSDGFVCYDRVVNWTDSSGYTCDNYRDDKKCDKVTGTSSGGVSGVLSIFSSDDSGTSNKADRVCCHCGGGYSIALPKCEGDCETAKAQAVADVRKDVDKVVDLTRQTLEEQGNVLLNRQAEKLQANVLVAKTNLKKAIQKTSGAAIKNAQDEFNNLTTVTTQESLIEIIRQHLVAVGYKTARDELERLKLNSTELSKLAAKAQEAWSAARVAWEKAHEVTSAAMETGADSLLAAANRTSELNDVLSVVSSINEATSNLTAARQATTFAHEAADISHDLVTEYKNSSAGMQAQLDSVTETAQKVQSMNQALTLRLKQLDAEVQKAAMQ